MRETLPAKSNHSPASRTLAGDFGSARAAREPVFASFPIGILLRYHLRTFSGDEGVSGCPNSSAPRGDKTKPRRLTLGGASGRGAAIASGGRDVSYRREDAVRHLILFHGGSLRKLAFPSLWPSLLLGTPFEGRRRVALAARSPSRPSPSPARRLILLICLEDFLRGGCGNREGGRERGWRGSCESV